MSKGMFMTILTGKTDQETESVTHQSTRARRPATPHTATAPAHKRKSVPSQQPPVAKRKREAATATRPLAPQENTVQSSQDQSADVQWEDFIDPAMLAELTGEGIANLSLGHTEEGIVSGHSLQAAAEGHAQPRISLEEYLLLMGVAPTELAEPMAETEEFSRAAQHDVLTAQPADPWNSPDWNADEWIQAEMRRFGVTQEDIDGMDAYAAANGGRVMPLPGQEHILQYAHFAVGTDGEFDPFARLQLREHPQGYDVSKDSSASRWYQ
jgi:hypothetical protein